MKTLRFMFALLAMVLIATSCQHCYNCIPSEFQSELYNFGVEKIAQRFSEAGDTLYYSTKQVQLTADYQDGSVTKKITVHTAYVNIYVLWDDYNDWNDARLTMVSTDSYYNSRGYPYFITQEEYNTLSKDDKLRYICMVQPFD